MINRKLWTAATCLGLMFLLGGHRLTAADPAKKQSEDAKAKLVAEGWKEISKGVFERQLGPDKVEHLGFGREGLAWTVGEMSRKLEFLREEQEIYPSEKLAKIIDDLNLKMVRAKRELFNLDNDLSQGLSSMTANVVGPSCSSICYSATADAYYLTNVQGVAAVAQAKFNSTCGYSGDTYAYAYARGTVGTTTTTNTQSDPRTGTNVTSSASASANGGSVAGIPCYSEASASVVSSALGISYSTSDTNNLCPAVQCTVTITGTSYEYFISGGCRSRTWTASLSPGCTGSTYQWKWNSTVVGSGSTYTRSICASNTTNLLEVTVNGTLYDSHQVVVEYEPCECCNTGQICP